MCVTVEEICSYNGSLPVMPASDMLVSGEAESVISALETHGVRVVHTKRNLDIATPVAYHPDMQFFFFPDGQAYMLQGNTIPDALIEMHKPLLQTKSRPERHYPSDVLCNAFYHNGAIYAKLDSLDDGILAYAYQQGIELIPVKQGYAACSVCTVNNKAVITADTGLAKACRTRGTDVLGISEGQIELPGYAYGFIGGCSGRIDNHTIAFTGRLNSHKDGKKMRAFIHSHHAHILELTDGPLVDIGGMINVSKWLLKRSDRKS